MSGTTVTTAINTDNHLQYKYEALKKFVRFPQDQRRLTIANATGSDITLYSGTLIGITTADQTIGKVVASAGNDGSQKPQCLVCYDTVIAAGESESVLVGFDGSIYADKIVLDGTDTLDTVITQEGISIRAAIQSYNSNISIVDAATEQSDYMNSQV